MTSDVTEIIKEIIDDSYAYRALSCRHWKFCVGMYIKTPTLVPINYIKPEENTQTAEGVEPEGIDIPKPAERAVYTRIGKIDENMTIADLPKDMSKAVPVFGDERTVSLLFFLIRMVYKDHTIKTHEATVDNATKYAAEIRTKNGDIVCVIFRNSKIDTLVSVLEMADILYP